ncbi:MAG: NADPH:quinone oxidoreductase family protein [Parvibaculaceae bacterium]
MRAVLCKAWGAPETLVVEELSEPEPGAGEIAVQVKAVGLNFLDTLIVEGKYQVRPDFPFSPAAEFAGVVKKLGKHVVGFREGDRVMAYTGYGAARETVILKAEQAIPVPAAIPFETAAGLTITYGTTLHALRDRANLKPNETLAVLGASGGVGQAAIEIGKLMGARVIACASSPEKLDFCRSIGADETIDYSSADLKQALRDATGGKGVDVIYDAVGGPYTEPALRSIAWAGRLLVIGFAAGDIPRIPLNLTLLKGCAIVGVFWGEHARREPERHRTNMTMLLNWCAEGKIRPHVERTWRLEETAKAIRALADRKVRGKAIVVV